MITKDSHPDLWRDVRAQARQAAHDLDPTQEDAVLASVPAELRQDVHNLWVRTYARWVDAYQSDY